jgi:positive regulator of sigma E activity
MDGLSSLLLQLVPPGQAVPVGLADYSVLVAALFLAIFSALALARQLLFAITVRD